MSNSCNADLSVTLGELEDELSLVKAAREQVDNVVLASTTLSESCDQLIASLTGLIQGSSEQFAEASQAFTKESNLLIQRTEAIERVTAESTKMAESILEQVNGAQEAIGQAAQDSVETVRQQASDAQESLEQMVSAEVKKASSEISGFTSQAIEKLDATFDETKSGIDLAVESLGTAESDARQGREELIKAHEQAMSEVKRQGSETKALLQETKEQLTDIDAKVVLLKELDIEGLVRSIEELKEAEASHADVLMKRITIVMAVSGACIILCLIVLARLFTS